MKSQKIAATPQNDFFENEELPEGWYEVPLSKILLTLESGSRPKGGVRGIETGIPSVGGEHLNDSGGFRFEKIKYIPTQFFEKMRRGRIQTGDILIVKDGATTGKVSIIRSDFPYNPAMVNEHVFICRFIERIYSPFVFYFLFSQVGQNRILENFQGSAQGGINQTFAENTIVPMAPFDEQQRIVARVEALLSHVNAARDQLNLVPLIMKKFRQAVLAAACSGRLTEEWRYENPGVEPAERLFEQIQAIKINSDSRKGKIKKKNAPSNFKDDNELKSDIVADLPLTWTISDLENITSRITSGSRWWKKFYCTDGPGTFILSQNVRPFFLNWSTVLHVDPPENDPDRKRSEVQKDDLLITIAGNTGDVCRVREDLYQHYVCQSVAMVRPVLKEISPYLEIYLNSPSHGQKQYDDWAYGEGRPHLSFDQLKKTTILLPPLAEQYEIVRRVGLLFECADAFDQEVVAARRRCERLTQAVLGKAFRGELVTA